MPRCPHSPSPHSLPTTSCVASAQGCSGQPPALRLGVPVPGALRDPQACAALAPPGAGAALWGQALGEGCGGRPHHVQPVHLWAE